MTSASSERAIRERNKRILRDRETNITVLSTLMRTVDGRRWIWNMLERLAVFRADEGLDPMRMAFDKGIRNEGLRLLADVTRICPSEYIRMTQENTGVDLSTSTESESDDGHDFSSSLQ